MALFYPGAHLPERGQHMPHYQLGELFCGAGGLACGAMKASVSDPDFRIVHTWANDFDADACRTFVKNICPDTPETVLCRDVRALDLIELPAIDALAFGFPCNDFSLVGEQKGIDGTYGPLYQYGISILQSHRPVWFLAENVGGLRSANGGLAFKTILGAMRDAGYTIYPHLYKFEEYGIPQSRHRIIIVGIRNDIGKVYAPPSPEPYANADNSCKTALEVPPITAEAFNNDLSRQSSTVIERLRFIKPGENAFNADLPPHLKLNVKGAKISQIYKRLDPDKPSYTVTGSGGGGTHIYHYDLPRALTNRERARLQTFPDDYEFLGSRESVRRQIGMAVPVKGAQIIFQAIMNTMAGISYLPVNCNISVEDLLE